jgi:hypothetical protein
MYWIVIDIIIPMLIGVELQDERMTAAILECPSVLPRFDPNWNRLTCRFSTDISLPPAIDTIYGLPVSGYIHAFFKATNREVI